MLDNDGVWYPSPQQVSDARVTRLAELLGVDGFDALYELSLADPERYWRGLGELAGFQWSRPFDKLLDQSEGKQFPRWFVGGELNFVDSIIAKASEISTPALIVELEDGRTSQIGYSELATAILRHAAGLRQAGVARGDSVGLLMEPGVEVATSLLALAALGAIAVPMFSGFGHEAISARLKACDARVLIATTGFKRRGRTIDLRPTVTEVVTGLPGIETLIVSDKYGLGDFPLSTPVTVLPWASVDAEPVDAIPVRMDPNDPFLILYTSGTTGAPKGTVHVHGGFPLKILNDAALYFDLGPGDRWLFPADMGWVAGSVTLLGALLNGATLVLFDGAPNWPDWSRIGQIIERSRVTHLGSSPTLIRSLAANEDEALRYDLSSLRLIITAGEAIAPEHFLWYSRAFGRGEAPVINYTGGTEVSGGLLGNIPVRPIRPSWFNSVTPGVVVDVLDPDGKPLENGVGELVVLEPCVGMTQGFWQDPARYLETYWETFPGIWAHGDLALRDETGCFQLLGRSDDMMKIAGKRLGPAEVEDSLAAIAGVAEVAAIGVPDPIKGTALVVFFVGDGEEAATGRQVVEILENSLGRAFKPAAVHALPEFPKNRSGKILRRILRRAYLGEPLGDVTALANPDMLDIVVRKGAAYRS